MHKIIIDTDFLLHALDAKVDIISELKKILDFNYEVYILDKTYEELKGKKNEKMAINFLKKGFKTYKTNMDKTVDELILDLNDEKIVVCTGDREFKEKLKKRNIPVINLRQRKYLVIENVL